MSEKTAEQLFEELMPPEPPKVTRIKSQATPKKKQDRFVIQTAEEFATGSLTDEYHIDGLRVDAVEERAVAS